MVNASARHFGIYDSWGMVRTNADTFSTRLRAVENMSVALETRVVVGDCAVLPALGALSTVLDEVMTMTERTGVMHGTIESVLVLP